MGFSYISNKLTPPQEMIQYYSNGLVYRLVKNKEVVCETTASSVEKAIEYFIEIGYDLYRDSDLKIDVMQS
jgi:hypothetical protein